MGNGRGGSLWLKGETFVMSRSTYIYLVMKDNTPVAAFTVKWEMQWWIERHPSTYTILRMRDGTHADKGEPVIMADNDG